MKTLLSENVKKKKSLKPVLAKVAIILGRLTKKLQPLEVGMINRSFKFKMMENTIMQKQVNCSVHPM